MFKLIDYQYLMKKIFNRLFFSFPMINYTNERTFWPVFYVNGN